MSKCITIVISDQQYGRIEAMARTGLFGELVDHVAEHLINNGIIAAIQARIIPLHCVSASPEPAFKCSYCEDGSSIPEGLTFGDKCPACQSVIEIPF